MKLSNEQKSNIRHFIYYLVNGTLDYTLLNTQLHGKYYEILKNNPALFFGSCCVFINEDSGANTWPLGAIGKRVTQFICKEVDPTFKVSSGDFEPWELDFEISGDGLSAEFKSFAKWYVNSNVVEDEGYKSYIECLASFVEQCFAIWTNVIEFENGKASNSEYCQERVMLYMKSYYGQIEKSNLEGWETELH